MSRGYIAVDLDGTLAFYDGWKGSHHIGDPIPKMLARVKRWLAEGKTVKVLTARASDPASDDFLSFLGVFRGWCLAHIGQILPVTATKDYQLIELWDDRAIQIIPNTGERADGLD